MRVSVFVEGESDRIALETLWAEWRQRLRARSWGIQIHSLDGKSQFLQKIGRRAAEKLVRDPNDLAVGLPDLYPSAIYANTEFRHRDIGELRLVQVNLVRKALKDVYQVTDATPYLSRFHATAFKHDSEMLLLAAKDALRAHLRTSHRLGNWRAPVEEQNHLAPPKRIVERLFMENLGRAYRETRDTKAVLNRVTNLREILYDEHQQEQCPTFRELLDWIGAASGVSGYQSPT